MIVRRVERALHHGHGDKSARTAGTTAALIEAASRQDAADRYVPGDVRELLEIYGVTDAEAESLVQLAREARRKGWWHTYGQALPPWFEAFIGLEAEAVRQRDFQSMVIPGLFQTEDYARAVLRAAPHPGSAEDIDRRVQLRMERQAVLTRASPPDLWIVLSESVLHVQVGSPTVMRA